MTERMLKFVSVEQRMPTKRDAASRANDFGEVYERFAIPEAEDQAARCSQCGIPFCQIHCPLHNNIPDWLKLTAEGRLEEAYELASATNTFPEVCGRVCPQDRLCEGNCVIERDFDAVTIGSVERHITDTAWEEGWIKPFTPSRERDQSVGIVGAGPGGLAAAERLRRKGYSVAVYDRYDRVGGLMIYGIPNFKLDKDIVERRARLYEDSGVTFHLDFEVGRDATLAELRAKHDAVVIATGVYKARDVPLPGAGLGNVFPAMTYLTASNRTGLGDEVPEFSDGTLNASGKDVVVIGGGDTAMDCVRTAVRQGAKSVKCLYRRDRENMPGSMREVANAEEEGVEFIWLAAPQAFVGKDGKPGESGGEMGDVSAVLATKMRLGSPDSTGRRSPEPVEDSQFRIDADIVIKALGFDPEDLPVMFDEPDLEVTRWGTLKVDYRTAMTNMDGVFAVGDIVRGASLVVWAIRDGRDAADSIHSYIQDKASPTKVNAGARKAPALAS
ncbi:MAG: NAD(P)-dependent oxidoreductase [Sphingomonadales bacterium]